VREEIHRVKREDEFYHYFAQVLSQKTVGVTGDERRYAYPIVVRIITSSDIMTADWAQLPHDFMARLSWRITNEVRGVTRVLYDITSKPPATTEWE
jgi:GMP synthase (glutamine-hydrolysing)